MATKNKNYNYLLKILEPYEPQLPISKIIIEVNKIFHSFDAIYYDQKHPEIYNQLPDLWLEMLKYVSLTADKWNILDLGCGTGFEAEQIIKNLPNKTISQIVCFDISSQMIDICRSKLNNPPIKIHYINNVNDINNYGKFNLIISNSFLHHLPDPLNFINSFLPIFSDNAIWIAGHEPSSRFYKNEHCMQLFNMFINQNKTTTPSFLDFNDELISYYEANYSHDPYVQTAKECFDKGLFLHKPNYGIIDRIVDFFVAHSVEEAGEDRGFDYKIMEQELSALWKLHWVKTYSYMGPYYEKSLPLEWKTVVNDLAINYPDDGANFCSIWQRI